MKKYDYLIVGAGLFGATVACIFADSGIKCLVIDRRNTIGGNCYSETAEGIEVHKYGPHIFHTSNQVVWEFANRFDDFIPFINSPLACYNGNIYNLPFNMNTFHKMWGVVKPEEAEQIIKKQGAEVKGDPQNLEEQAIQMVGRDLYETLIKGYTEKQWGRSCKDLPSSIIKRIPLRFTYDNNYYQDTYQGLPRTGYTSWISNMLGETDIELGLDYFDIPGGYKSISEQVIFTGRIDEYYECCYGELEYRTLEFREETLNVVNFQGNAIMNYTQREIPYTRIIEHKHFKKQPSSMSIITKEYPAEWKNGQEPYYPIRDPGNIARYNKYLEHANSDANVRFGGRLGLYQYLDMDQTIYEAMRLAEHLIKK